MRKDGTPILFYTSIGKDRLPEQWAAIPEDDELIKWKKHPANPILTEAIHGETKIHEWRDPYLFDVNGVVHMVCGGNTNASKGGEGVVCVYRSDNEDLTKWTYLGVLFKHPDAEVKNVECPIFFKLDGRWVLITSQGQPVDWFVGDLDEKTMRFTPKTRGKVDYGQVYAPSVLVQGVERPILWGWINGVPGGKGWRHCLTVPRELSIRDGQFVQIPVSSLLIRPLLGDSVELLKDQRLVAGKVHSMAPAKIGPQLLSVFVDLGNASSFKLDITPSAAGSHSIPIRYDRTAERIHIGTRSAPMPLSDDGRLTLAIYLDHGVLELWEGEHGRTWLTDVVNLPAGETQMAVEANGASVQVKVHGFPIHSIWDR